MAVMKLAYFKLNHKIVHECAWIPCWRYCKELSRMLYHGYNELCHIPDLFIIHSWQQHEVMCTCMKSVDIWSTSWLSCPDIFNLLSKNICIICKFNFFQNKFQKLSSLKTENTSDKSLVTSLNVAYQQWYETWSKDNALRVLQALSKKVLKISKLTT